MMFRNNTFEEHNRRHCFENRINMAGDDSGGGRTMMFGNNTFEEHNRRHCFGNRINMAGDDSGGGPPRSFTTWGRKSRQDPPVLVILGPTGSGKTGVSIKLAKKLNGEIISADSRAIYKGMDIGTAKPSREEQSGVPHYGLDLVEPGERFTVADWKQYTSKKIASIKARGKVPIIVGGTGLYIDSLIYDYHFKGPTGHKIGDFEQKSCSDRTGVKGDFLLIGIKWPAEELRIRLKQRIDQMYDEPLFTETRQLVQKYGWDSQAMKSNVYQFVWQYLNHELSLDDAKLKSFYADWHLAKRQMTWFKRNPEIIWLELEKVYPFVLKYIQNE